jgi:hypothetical protein
MSLTAHWYTLDRLSIGKLSIARASPDELCRRLGDEVDQAAW